MDKDFKDYCDQQAAARQQNEIKEQDAEVVLAQIRQMCCDMTVSSGIGKRVHEFALVVWKHVEQSRPNRTPAQWSALIGVEQETTHEQR